MSCGWDVKWLAFTKESHGANFQSKRLGIDEEMDFFQWNLMLSYTTIRQNIEHIMDNSQTKCRLDELWMGCKVVSIHQRKTWC
jgi:hypothetical protein